jgi:hypothetical protein
MFNNRKVVSSDLCATLHLDRKRGGKTALGQCTERTITLAANLDGNNINIFKSPGLLGIHKYTQEADLH